jgi:ankyrin repeat protein
MTIYYWNQATTLTNLFDNPEIKECVENLLTGNYNHGDLEKLNGPQNLIIYSFRLNRSGRLLFTTHDKSLHVLEHLPTHDYQKSRYLKRSVLRMFLDKNKSETFQMISREADKPVFQKRKPGEVAIRLDYFDHQFIKLSDEQDHLLSAQLPLIVTGPAGSGKTYTALSMLSNYIASDASLEKPLLYLAKNERLVHSIREMWNDFVNEEDGHKVHFMTYHQLAFGDATIVDKTYFFDWHDALPENNLIKMLSPNLAYQEFRTCSGFDLRDYSKLGERQSQIHQPSDRELSYGMYLRYLDHLDRNGKIDPNFSNPLLEKAEAYSLIVFDEAQLMSIKALQEASHWAEKNKIVYCMDPHQNIEDAQATRAILELSFYNKELHIHSVRLNKTHRSPLYVANLVNKVIDMEYFITGGKIDKEEVGSICVASLENKGHIHLIKTSELSQTAPWLINRAKTNHLAVITPEDFVAEACTLFNTALVFTPSQIQGLGYHTVVMYKMLANDASSNVLRNIAPKLKFFNGSNSSSPNRAKSGKSDFNHAIWFRTLYVALTRASNTLVWVDSIDNTSRALLHQINQVVTEYQTREAAEEQGALDVLPETNWADEKERLLLGGYHEQLKRLQSTTALCEVIKSDITAHGLSKPRNWRKIQKEFIRALDFHADDGSDIPALFGTLKANPWLSPNLITEQGETLLMLAIYFGYEQIALDLIEHKTADEGIDLNKYRKDGRSALQFAISTRKYHVIKKLIQDPRLSLENENLNCLIMACEIGDIEILTLLLSSDKCQSLINVSSIYSGQTITLLSQAVQTERVEVVSLLLSDERINLTLQDIDKAVQLSCQKSSSSMLKIFLENKQVLALLQPNVALKALIWAARTNDAGSIRQLLTYSSVDPNATRWSYMVSDSFTIEELASFLNNDSLALETVEETALEQACKKSSFDAIEALLNDERILTTVLNEIRQDPLLFWKEKSIQLIKLLLKNELIFKMGVNGMLKDPASVLALLNATPCLFVGLISYKNKLFEYISSATEMRMSTVEHKQFLTDTLLNFKSNQRTPLQLILFKRKNDGSFFDNDSNIILERLNNLVRAYSDADIEAKNI